MEWIVPLFTSIASTGGITTAVLVVILIFMMKVFNRIITEKDAMISELMGGFKDITKKDSDDARVLDDVKEVLSSVRHQQSEMTRLNTNIESVMAILRTYTVDVMERKNDELRKAKEERDKKKEGAINE